MDYELLAHYEHSAGGSTHTYSSVGFGAVASDRVIFIEGVWRQSGSAPVLSSVTIGGEAATILENYKSGTTTASGAFGALVELPSGASGDIVLNFSAAASSSGIAVWRFVRLASLTPTDIQTSSADPRSVSIDVAANGLAVALDFNNYGAASTPSWSGLTEDFRAAIIVNAHHFSGASLFFESEELGYSVGDDWSTDDGSAFGRAMVVISFEFLPPVVYAISGVVTLQGAYVEGATVRCIRQSDNVALAAQITDSTGEYVFSDLDVEELYHLAVEYEVGGERYNALSLWDIVPVEVV